MRFVSRKLLPFLFFGPVTPVAFAQNMVGIGVGMAPDYPGAKSYRAQPAPLLNAEWGPLFTSSRFGGPAVGVKTRLPYDLSTGLLLGLSPDRRESRNAQLQGLGNINFSAQYGAFVEWAPGPFSASLSYMQSAKSAYGGTLTLRGSYLVLKEGRNAVTLGGDVTWGSSNYMQTWFGVTPEQATRSTAGLPAHQMSSGIRSASVLATWRYSLNANWAINSTVGVQTLLGNTTDSPLVERKASPFGLVGITYSFK